MRAARRGGCGENMSFAPTAALKNMRWCQYRLVTLFSLVTLASLPLAVCAHREHQYRVRLAAVRLLQNNGYSVGVPVDDSHPTYNDLLNADVILQRDEVVSYVCPSSTISADELKAIMCFPTIRALDFRDYEADPAKRGSIDPSMTELSKLPSVEWLDLQNSSISDDGVRYLGRMRSLRILDLEQTRITGATFKYLSGLVNLEELDLRDTDVGDDGAGHLEPMVSLRSLDMRGTKISGGAFRQLRSLQRLIRLDVACTNFNDEGAHHVAALRSLENLTAGQTKITSAALEALSTIPGLRSLELFDDDVGGESLSNLTRLSRLEYLGLAGTQVSDEDLKFLQGLRSLQSVVLNHCAISDACLPHLRAPVALKYVFIERTGVTGAGAARLKASRPQLAVYWRPRREGWVTQAEAASIAGQFGFQFEIGESSGFSPSWNGVSIFRGGLHDGLVNRIELAEQIQSGLDIAAQRTGEHELLDRAALFARILANHTAGRMAFLTDADVATIEGIVEWERVK